MPNHAQDALGALVQSAAVFAYGDLTMNKVRQTPEHRHGKGQLIGIDQGLMTIVINGSRHLVPSRQVVWLPPYVPHGLTSHGAFSGWSVYVDEAICVDLPQDVRTLPRSELLWACVRRLASWVPPPLLPSVAQQRVLAVLMDELNDLPEAALSLPYPTSRAVQKVAAALLADVADPRTLTDWASVVGLSPRSLSRKFSQETSLSFTQWRQQARLLRALALLAEGRSVTTTALSVGYENVSAFINLFQQRLGITPRRYCAVAHPQEKRLSS